MARTTFRLPADSFDSAVLGLDIRAVDLDLTVVAVAGLTEVTVELTGPADVIEGATASEDQMWVIDIPAPTTTSGTFSGGNVVNRSFGGGSVIQAGNVYGDVVFSGGSLSINGRTVTGSQQDGEPVRAVARVPRSSVLSARITSGSVVTRGRMSSVTVTGQSTDARIEHADRADVNTASGNTTIGKAQVCATVHTVSGNVTVESGGTVDTLRTTSGNITYTAGTEDSRLVASTTSGNVSVIRRGYRVSSRVSSVSGRVREW